ncbi:MAG: hypothetical protein M1818_001166 [Claussenomyces sp. TS43310]|nr:MAG: hypothetical protein M1818_001166 [Claussenomyces sp. TS43310]
MAPSATETTTLPSRPDDSKASLKVFGGGVGAYKEMATVSFEKDAELKGKDGFEAAKYPHYLPTWNPDLKYPPLVPFEHYDHGKDADPSFPNLLKDGVKTSELTPTIGTEVHGVQLSSLSPAGKDELALFVAQRRMVVFRDQDFADLPIKDALAFGSYFGRHHIHQTSGSPEGYPEVHLVHRGAGDKSHETFFQTRTSSVAWHSDITFEAQPPGTTFLYALDVPETGGDTLFADSVAAYNRLSPAFQERLHGLKAVHSGVEQIEASRLKGSIVKREPVMHEHPIVRTHPVTGEKALYVNPQFTRYIVGYKQEESDYLLKFLYDHIALGADFQARARWAPKTVVIWDNRVAVHTALVDWNNGQRRHIARITPQAERPFETPFKA